MLAIETEPVADFGENTDWRVSDAGDTIEPLSDRARTAFRALRGTVSAATSSALPDSDAIDRPLAATLYDLLAKAGSLEGACAKVAVMAIKPDTFPGNLRTIARKAQDYTDCVNVLRQRPVQTTQEYVEKQCPPPPACPPCTCPPRGRTVHFLAGMALGAGVAGLAAALIRYR